TRLAWRCVPLRPQKRREDEPRIVWGGGIQLGKRRQAFFYELFWNPATHGGYPLASLHCFTPRADRSLNVSDRGRGLETRVVAGTQSEQHEVIVVIDEPRNGGAATEINYLHAGTTTRVPIVADRCDFSVLDCHRRY